ncbi:type II toxin-antitoxin system RelE/ParE family toxin [Anaerotruncus rubiinfantis]|uniref:type II toxin-antitoxin system RelE/ParE family toxin n=1 Tax=Anaerotruncus rubiinfantis TaxID=1720200 RepID=UPI0011C81E56|nr:type II toxin-antitoxin system RelE/ParE family toxin [Anaerotruncus rubiinfantis]
MTREFVLMPEFERQWADMGLDDQDLRRLQEMLLLNPQAGPVMQGTGRLRKMRFAYGNKGKSGSARVAYVDFLLYEKIYLITAYPKNQKDNLSKEERNIVKQLIEQLEAALERGN